MTTVFIALLGVIFIALGVLKLIGIPPLRKAFSQLNMGTGNRIAIGSAELLFGAALAASALIAPLTFFAAIPLLAICLGAVAIHALRPPLKQALPAAVLALGLVAAVVLNPLGLRILMLPAADQLPRKLLVAQVIAAFAPGSFLESVTIAPDGAVWISETVGADMATFDLSNATARVLRRDPSGSETTVFSLPPGNVAGVGAFAPDGTFYVTVTGKDAGVWQFKPGGADSSPLVRAPAGVNWNGLKLGPDGMLYAAGDRDGAIWRIDTGTAKASKVISDPALAARNFVALAPGANGLEFRGRDLIVTVSDRATLWSASPKEDGSFGPLQLIAQGIPGDDIAIAADGRIFIATHPYNTVVEVGTDGARTIIADETTHATGSTDLAIAPDGKSLYMVTDGGLLTGVSGASGKLVQLSLP